MARWSPNAKPNTVSDALRQPILLAILAVYLVIALSYSVITPLFEASDELWHYPFIVRLTEGEGLPVQSPDQVGPWRQEGSQPPLYYFLGAVLTSQINTDDLSLVRWLNPHADIGVIAPDGNANMAIHPPRKLFPLEGTRLAVYVVRWFSVVLGAVTVVAGYLLANQIFGDRQLALVSSATTAFNAMFLFITASVNNDALVISLSAVALWLMVRYIASRPTVIHWLLLGTVLGAACLTKTSALALLPLAALTVLVVAISSRSIDDFIYGGVALLIPVAAIAGWWYWRNWRFYQDPLGLNAFLAIVGPRSPVPTLRQLLSEWKGFVMSYWGFFGGVNVPAPRWYYWAMSILALTGFAGAPLYLLERVRSGWLTSRRRWQLVLTVLLPLAVFAALVRWTLLTVASQGRLMFPAITAISLWAAMGWVGLVRGRLRTLMLAAVGAFMAISAALLPFVAIRPAYALPKVVSASSLQPQQRLDATFGDAIRLLGYDLPQSELVPGQPVTVTLYYECLAAVDADYTLFVHLVNQDDLIVGQRDRYPGQGRFPTSLWQPGRAFSDTVVISSNPAMLTPNQLGLATGFYRREDGTRLSLAGGGDAVYFGELSVAKRVVNGVPNPMRVNLADEVALVGYELECSTVRAGESVNLTLYWRAQRDLAQDYTVFVQILDTQGDKLAQIDRWPQDGAAPTSTWKQGQLIVDRYTLVLDQDAQSQIATLLVGMYDTNVVRLSVLGEGGHVQDTAVVLGKLHVLATGS